MVRKTGGVTGTAGPRMNTPGLFCSTRDILAVIPSDIAMVGLVRMRGHCRNEVTGTVTYFLAYPAIENFRFDHFFSCLRSTSSGQALRTFHSHGKSRVQRFCPDLAMEDDHPVRTDERSCFRASAV